MMKCYFTQENIIDNVKYSYDCHNLCSKTDMYGLI